MGEHFKRMKEKYPNAPRIHLILDNGPYNKSKETLDAAKEFGIILHFLPPYSPNLNPIERLWKVMNEEVRNNVVFEKVSDFRKIILNFFHVDWDKIKDKFRSRINDNFSTIKLSPVPSG